MVIDMNEVEAYRRQILELTENNRQLQAIIQRTKEPADRIKQGSDSEEDVVHIEEEIAFHEVCTQTSVLPSDETVEVLVEFVEVEVQTEVGFEHMMSKNLTEFEGRMRKTEFEKGELAKELSLVRKNLLETQRKIFKDKEISQQAYSALVRKYEDDCSKFAQEREQLMTQNKERAREAESLKRDRSENIRLIEGLRGRESFQLQYIDDLNSRNDKLSATIR